MKTYLRIILFSLILAGKALAGVNTDLVSFFNKMGASTNATEASAYHDQSAGYYTGGSLFSRNTVHNAQLGSVRLPGYRAGCGGIDMHMGAFSFIGSEELIKAFKTIGSNMGSYGLLLAMETMSPQVKNIITELNDLAQKINQSNINSCEIAATTLGAILPKSDAANKHLCTMIGSDRRYGGFTDYAAAKQGCGAGGRRDEVIEGGKSDPRFAKMLGTEFNLAWMAIQENEFLRQDKDLAYFFMTISGTIISKRHEDGYMIRVKPSLVDNESLLNILLKGGSLKIYKCMDVATNKCLEVNDSTIVIKPENAFEARIKNILNSIQNKIFNDEPLSEPEKAFLNSTKLPFYKILNVSTAFRRGESPLDIADYSELGAVDVLFQYLSEILDVVNESAANIKSAQVDDTQIQRFQESLNTARERVIDKRMATFKQVEQITSIIKKTEMLEKMISSKLGLIAAEGL